MPSLARMKKPVAKRNAATLRRAGINATAKITYKFVRDQAWCTGRAVNVGCSRAPFEGVSKEDYRADQLERSLAAARALAAAGHTVASYVGFFRGVDGRMHLTAPVGQVMTIDDPEGAE
jgi:hypothetical protein